MPTGRPVTIGFKNLTLAEKRAYRNATSKRYRTRKFPPKARKIDHGELRQCKHCEQKLPRTEEFFYASKNSRNGLSTVCRKCLNKQSRRYVLRNTFGGTLEEYTELMSTTACAICGSKRFLRLDHCHDRMHVRGVLCNTCNTTLGRFDDDPERFKRAAAYLELDRQSPGANLPPAQS